MSSNTPHEYRQTHEVVLSERERQYLGLVARGKHPSHVAVIVGADEADVKDTLEKVDRVPARGVAGFHSHR